MDDNSVYNAISDRIDMKEIDSYRIVPKSLLVNDL
uniref:Ubiquitin-like oligomerization domain protein n=1 Tax=Podoviridae sp. ct8Lf7 TaxID=2827723 RepID=A0A8S5S1G4_9CAUD|nr:MAG TPA: Ubiquitin-like oligomerization domain protein [Podoviridae sp. ct8Lf7]